MAKHFLYLTNERLTCLLWRGGRFVTKDHFPARNPYSLEFERYVARYKGVPAYLVLDLTEEDFRVETIPHLRAPIRRRCWPASWVRSTGEHRFVTR